MSLTTSQKLGIKKHLGQHPSETIIDPLISTLEDGDAMESELVVALGQCDSTLDAINTAEDEADELVEGGGARFDYNRRINIKKQSYHRAVCNLARLIGWPMPGGNEVTGFFAL